MKCDYCISDITDDVYWVKGINYNCCSLECLAHLILKHEITTIEERFNYLNIE